MHDYLTLLIRAALITMALAAAPVRAVCLPTAQPVYVGNTATDSQCDYDSIQAAISAAVCPETIVVTNERNYGPQHLLIADKSLSLVGSSGACGMVVHASGTSAAGAAPVRLPLTGNDNVDQAVVTITGNSHVTLANFSISGARDISYTTNNGGGIVFLNYGSLTLDNVEVWNSYAGNGGGIAMLANGGHADLVIGSNTVIHDNIAQFSGGGIYLSGDVHLLMVQDQSAVYGNIARGKDAGNNDVGGYGGGIYLAGGRADIGSPGLSGCTFSVCPPQGAAIANNQATSGGGIAVFSDGIRDGVATAFTTVPSRPTTLSGNSGTFNAGAVYANSAYAQGHRAAICLFETNILGNQAPVSAVGLIEAAALYVNTDPSGVCAATSLPALGTTDCDDSAQCNTMAFNQDTAVAGDELLRLDNSDLVADRFALRENQAAFAIITLSNEPHAMRISNCLVSDNQFKASAIYVDDGIFNIDGCTFAGNTLVGNRFFTLYADAGSSTTLNLTRSIAQGDADDKTALYVGPSALHADYNLLSDLSSVSGGTANFSADPDFVDPAHGDYHLAYYASSQPYSPAIDYAPASGSQIDLDGHTRNFDMAGIPNQYGPRDLGAYELHRACAAADTLFCDGFELPLHF